MPGADRVRVPNAPFAFAKDGPRIDTPPPRLGQHNDEILAEQGYDPDDIAALRQNGAI